MGNSQSMYDLNSKADPRFLLSAITDGSLKRVKQAIRTGADVNFMDENGRTPLSTLVVTSKRYRNHKHAIKVLKELTKCHADVNVQDQQGRTILHLVCLDREIDPSFIDEIIKSRVDINIKDGSGQVALHVAAENGRGDIIRSLARHYHNTIDFNVKDGSGQSALFLATQERQTALFSASQKIFPDPSLRDHILHVYDALKALLECGADPDIKCVARQGRTRVTHQRIVPEDVALDIDVKIKDDIHQTALHVSLVRGDTDLVKQLITNNADVNATDSRRMHPISAAVGNMELTKKLLDAGAVADILDPSGLDILHTQLVDFPPEHLRLIVKDASSVNARGSYGRTILHLAASLGCRHHTVYLLSCRGIDVNATDIFGQTPLHCATQIGDKLIINKLLDAGADLNYLDQTGQSVLHTAATYGHCNLTERFIQMGMDSNTQDKQGRNCLHCAVMYRKEEVVKLLLLKGADSQMKDYKGKTPKDYLNSCEESTLIWKLLNGEASDLQVLAPDSLPLVRQDAPCLLDLSGHPGLGSVKAINGFDMSAFVDTIKKKVEEVMCEALSAEVEVLGCGSAFEGSKVGIPDEVDLLVKLFRAKYVEAKMMVDDKKQGYRELVYDRDRAAELNIDHLSYGVWLWRELMAYWSKLKEKRVGIGCNEDGDAKSQFLMPLLPQRHPHRTACITWVWLYSDDTFKDFPISIDLVPAIEVGREPTLSFFVPKIPFKGSAVSERFQEGDLHKLGRESHPTLEVDYLRNVDQRVVEVFIVCKCLRKPEICGFKVKNEKGDLVPASEYITSYRLKTVLLTLAKYFLNTDMSLGKMALMVYEFLEKCIEERNLPMVFDEKINVLAGSRLSLEYTLLAARQMTLFVRTLYERDFASENERDYFKEKIALLERRMDGNEKYSSQREIFLRHWSSVTSVALPMWRGNSTPERP